MAPTASNTEIAENNNMTAPLSLAAARPDTHPDPRKVVAETSFSDAERRSIEGGLAAKLFG